ncbi:hypothetical protein ATI61_104460 [Archangium gephyra]|uniref:Uncharacterized protein n=1 Tax=Archangium gephyra TaxID=48 RepID=A0AAC8Q305_9BACT|nr:hypothetical protein [Archangium gephyra]AKJ00130.1 Hypothetical protein AA314_01756 [Archangium gephyra]REG33170.1 hypothetical protein ATI61_104460 [Archangium gephyra]
MAFLIGFVVFFLVIALTIILGGISRMGDRRVTLEGRPTEGQRLPTDREAHGY